MHPRGLLVVCLAVSGVFVLAGAGWALVTAAALVAVLWRDQSTWVAAAAAVSRVWRKARDAPRRAVAATSMGAGVMLLPSGVGILGGVGALVVAAAAVLVSIAVLTGWNH